jgi:hypothetical protein
MDIESTVIRNTEDINKVTAAVSELTLTMKFEMERGKEERESVKSMLLELRGINEKMGSITALTAKVAELDGALGKQRHDLKNLENIQQVIPLFNEKLNNAITDIAVLQSHDIACKEWRDKHDGAANAMRTAVKAMWTVSGTGVISVVGFVLYLFFTNTTPALVRHIGDNTYTGHVVSGE